LDLHGIHEVHDRPLLPAGTVARAAGDVPTPNNATTRTTPTMIRARMEASCLNSRTDLAIRHRAGVLLAHAINRARACFAERRAGPTAGNPAAAID
jgi:hypothetical protein